MSDSTDYIKVRGSFWIERGPLDIGWRAKARFEAPGRTVNRTFWTWRKAKAEEILLGFQRWAWKESSR